MELRLEDLELASGMILLEENIARTVYSVIKVAKNANYEGLGKPIMIGDKVVLKDHIYRDIKILYIL